MILILPLEKPSEAFLTALRDGGINPDALNMCLRLDLDLQGEFGEVWLAYSAADAMLYRVAEGKAESFPLADLTEPYIDNYATSNRLQVHHHAPNDRPPEQGEMTDDEYRRVKRAYESGGNTVILGYCTNTCKARLLAFVQLWDRLERGDEVGDDDPLFLQFNRTCPTCGRFYTDQKNRVCGHCARKKGLLRRLLSYFVPFRMELVVTLSCLFATTLLGLISPIVSGQILFDEVITPEGSMHELKYVYLWVGVLIGMAMLSVGINIVHNRVNARLSTHVTCNMKNDIFAAMQRLSLSYFNANPTGSLITRINHDAERVRNFFIDGVPYFISQSLSYIILTVVLFCLNWKLTLVLYLPIIPIVLILRLGLPKLWKAFFHVFHRSSSMSAMMNDSLSGYRVVKAFAKEDDESDRFSSYSYRLSEAGIRANRISMFIFPVISLLVGAICHTMWGFTGFAVIGGRMTYGELLTYISYSGMIFGPLTFFTNFSNTITDTLNSAVRMFEVLDMTPEITESPSPVRVDKMRGNVEFSHVCFHYSPNRPILKDLTFTIREGDRVGLVGHTGSGKSTIANLITRMYDVVSGSVTIDGVDVKDMEMASLRRNVAIVSQEVYIFGATVMDNIRYGRPDATRAEVVAAAKAANAHNFIMQLPEGYETVVGIGSRSLSGGERQRVSIARALLLNPALLILDEATAAMDTETERQIAEAIDRVSAGKTTISIAHRLSTLKNCNVIIAIDNGELAEMGSHDELMAKEGLYYRLYTLQNEQLQKVMEGS